MIICDFIMKLTLIIKSVICSCRLLSRDRLATVYRFSLSFHLVFLLLKRNVFVTLVLIACFSLTTETKV